MADNYLLTDLADLQRLVRGAVNSQSMAMLNNVMAETVGMSMHNAVTVQHNAQMLSSAATTSTCAKILSVPSPKPAPPPPPVAITVPAGTTIPVTPVTPLVPVTATTPPSTPPATPPAQP